MTEALTRVYGPHRGAEELTHQLGLVFGELIRHVDEYRGAVIGFSGDAITCWFDGDDGLRATAASLAMQHAMVQFARIPLAGDEYVSLQVKTAVVVGPIRRFLVGDPDIQLIDAVAGETLDVLAEAERLTESGEVVVSEQIAQGAHDSLVVRAWRAGAGAERKFAVVERLDRTVERTPWPVLADDALAEHDVRAWVMPDVYDRLRQGLSAFLAEFRPATALFLSFRGIDYDRDADAGGKLDRFVRWVQAKIAAHEGSLIQLTIGDKGSSYLYAAFGAPVAHHDASARAVATALEIRLPPPDLAYVRDIRIGVTHGQMYAGAYGSPTRRTYGVLGAKTNLSARLMGKAAPGQILCDEEVAQRAGRTFRFASLGVVQVKGKSEPVPIFTPEERRSFGPGERAGAEEGPLVGRATDLAAFEQILDEAAARRGRVTFLEGEAGIGKSRVVHALIRLGRERGATVLVGAAQSGAQQLPYRAWRDAISTLLGLEETMDAQARRDQVAASLLAGAPSLQDRLPLLNDLLPLDAPESAATSALDPGARQSAVAELLVALLVSAAERAPLALVLEDAHWLDSLSWELAERVARALAGASARAWLLIVHRPLDAHHVGARRAAALQTLPRSHVMRLGPLSPDELVDLVAHRLAVSRERIPAAVADLMHERASGNPFIAEELLQTLQDQGLVTLEERQGVRSCRVSPQLAQGRFSLPDTLQGLILSRIDRLPADGQLVLKVAAVIGRLFTVAPLRDTLARLGWAERGVRPSLLRELTRRGFVVPEGIEHELKYLFRHVITHEVVYQTLLFAQRRQVHRAVAEWFERGDAGGRELAAVLAHHWSVAAEGNDDPETIERAGHYLLLAGGHGARLGAYPEAIAAYERAIALVPTTEAWATLRTRLHLQLGTVHEHLGAYGIAKEHLERALGLARSSAVETSEAQALDALGVIARRQGNYDEAERLSLDALAIAEARGDRAASARAWVQLGTLSAYRSGFDAATDQLLAALAIYEELDDRDGIAGCVNSLGVVATLREDFAAAMRYFERALDLARTTGDREGVGMYLSNLGVIAENRTDYVAAERYYAEGLEIAKEIDAKGLIVSVMLGLGDVAAATNRSLEAYIEYDEALHGAVDIGAMPQALLAVCGLALLDHRAGRIERAAERVGLVLAHPALNSEVEPRARTLLEELRGLMTPEDLAAATARGERLTLEGEAALT
ncbi:MAG: tetratricopeptide repeat protein [Trueperaceae bacterium]|nr:tetratricopeptide repeat protein [Trueperaceae bacterium]